MSDGVRLWSIVHRLRSIWMLPSFLGRKTEFSAGRIIPYLVMDEIWLLGRFVLRLSHNRPTRA